jgi:hypothetical protein
MEKKVSAGFIILAVIAMMAFSAFPHHHHLMKVCFALEKCDIDGQVNDRHTGHQSTPDHYSVCKFFAQKSAVHPSAFSQFVSNTGKLFLLLFTFFLGFLYHYLKTYFREAATDDFSVSLYHCLLTRYSGRRGPPYRLI